MSDPNSTPNQIESYKIWAPLVGAFLSILGGFAAVFIRARLEKKQEIEYIKIGLKDELHEMCVIIGHLNETFNKTQMLSNGYLNDLTKNTEAFKFHKQRLFLIRSESLRRKIVSYYKRLDEIISDSINTVGTLGEAKTGTDHGQIVEKFNKLAEEANEIETKLTNYKYRLLWFSNNS